MISIIITAFREPKTIGKAIESVIANKIDNYEILVYAPDEETINVAKKYTEKFNNLKVIQDPGKGKPIALNMAFKEAKGEILVLTDGDVFINNNSIEKLISFFEDKKVGAVTGRPIPINERNTMLGFWSHLLTEAGAHRRRIELQEKNRFITCSGYLMAIRSNIINSIPDNSLSDDAIISNLIYKAGFKTKYSPEAIVNVKFPTTFTDWIKQKKRSAGGYNQLKTLINEKDSMRSFSKESSKIMWALSYPKNIKEFFWTIVLIFSRLYLWLLIFIDINIKKNDFEKVWVRIESTK